jgi:hypothetical protein
MMGVKLFLSESLDCHRVSFRVYFCPDKLPASGQRCSGIYTQPHKWTQHQVSRVGPCLDSPLGPPLRLFAMVSTWACPGIRKAVISWVWLPLREQQPQL